MNIYTISENALMKLNEQELPGQVEAQGRLGSPVYSNRWKFTSFKCTRNV